MAVMVKFRQWSIWEQLQNTSQETNESSRQCEGVVLVIQVERQQKTRVEAWASLAAPGAPSVPAPPPLVSLVASASVIHPNHHPLIFDRKTSSNLNFTTSPSSTKPTHAASISCILARYRSHGSGWSQNHHRPLLCMGAFVSLEFFELTL